MVLEVIMSLSVIAHCIPNTVSQNTAIGSKALRNNTSGIANTATGFQSLFSNTTGRGNVANGMNALRLNVTGNNNVAVGDSALLANTVSANTAVGSFALRNTSTGNNNASVGLNALVNNTTGSNNTAIGYQANSVNTTGSKNTAIGYNATVGSNNLTNATAIGAHAYVTTSNSLVLGGVLNENGATIRTNVGIGVTNPVVPLEIDGGTPAILGTDPSGYLSVGNPAWVHVLFDASGVIQSKQLGAAAPLFLNLYGGNVSVGGGVGSYVFEVGTNSAGKPGGGSWSAVSDARLKKDIHDFNDGLEVLKQIHPVRYKYNELSGVKDTSTFVGIIAQELKEIAPYMIGQFTKKDDGQQYYDYDGSAMTYILINAVQEQQDIIEQQQKTNDELLQKLNTLEAQVQVINAALATKTNQ
jgi:hypothetical protein